MEFGFSAAQDILRMNVKRFMKKEASLAHVRQMEDDPEGFSPELWHKIAELGWIGLDYPKQYGGVGGNFLDVVVVAEEMGRALFPSPYIAAAVVAGHCIVKAGDTAQRTDILPRFTKGEVITTLALTEPSGTYEASGIETTATRAPAGGYRLSGVKLLVPFAHVADVIIVAARTSDSGPAEDGLSLFMVDPKSAGISIAPVRIISQEKQSEVVFRDTEVPQASLLGTSGASWPVVAEVLDRGKVALSADMVGGAQSVLEIATEYAKERMQFGKPIGQFQAIKHRLADLATQIEGARWLTYGAACEIDEGEHGSMAASMAKAFIGEVYVRAARAAVQTYGGYGYMKECDVQLFFRRAKAAEAIFGGQHYNRELSAQHML